MCENRYIFCIHIRSWYQVWLIWLIDKIEMEISFCNKNSSKSSPKDFPLMTVLRLLICYRTWFSVLEIVINTFVAIWTCTQWWLRTDVQVVQVHITSALSKDDQKHLNECIMKNSTSAWTRDLYSMKPSK